MCLVFFVFGCDPPQPRLLLAFNRDEFFRRPTQPLHVWEDGSGLLAGRDLSSGGTWLGLNVRAGRFAFLTNLRSRDPVEPSSHSSSTGASTASSHSASRGELVTAFLTSSATPQEYLQSIPRDRYQGFNLVVGDLGTTDPWVATFGYLNNGDDAPQPPVDPTYGTPAGPPHDRATTAPAANAIPASGSAAGSCDCGSSAAAAGTVAAMQQLQPGRVYGLSNGCLMEWPKVTSGVEVLHELLPSVVAGRELPYDRLFSDLLGDRHRRVPRPHDGGSQPPPASRASTAGATGDSVRDTDCTRARRQQQPFAPSVAVAAGTPECSDAADGGAQIHDVGDPPEQFNDVGTFRRALEHITSGRFVSEVQTPYGKYGTRSQTVMVVWHDGTGEARERHRCEDGSWGETVVPFRLDFG